MNKIIDNYIFNSKKKTITLTDYQLVKLARIVSIKNVTKNLIIYEVGKNILSISGNVINISSTDKMESSDELQIIYYDDPSNQDIVIHNNISTGGGSTVRRSFTAGAIINGGKAVWVDTDGLLYPFNITTTSQFGRCIGIAESSTVIGDSCSVVLSGESNLVGSGWVAGELYYISSTGFLSTTPPTSGWCQVVGAGIDNEKICVSLQLGLQII